MNEVIYTFWTGDNPLTESRKLSLQNLNDITGCKIVLITKNNLNNYILKEAPLHEGYIYLSETHKADYLRTYFMHFYGGGYSDIKRTTGPWLKGFYDLENSDKWILGYEEIGPGGIAYKPAESSWKELIGNGAYICKKQTPLTQEWYSEMICVLDSKLDDLRKNPAKSVRDCSEQGTGYPIGWNEMLGRIFHKVCLKYKDKILNTLPPPICYNYF
jgi:hypothetical protein